MEVTECANDRVCLFILTERHSRLLTEADIAIHHSLAQSCSHCLFTTASPQQKTVSTSLILLISGHEKIYQSSSVSAHTFIHLLASWSHSFRAFKTLILSYIRLRGRFVCCHGQLQELVPHILTLIASCSPIRN